MRITMKPGQYFLDSGYKISNYFFVCFHYDFLEQSELWKDFYHRKNFLIL